MADTFARYIREKTGDGREVVDFMIRVLRGEPLGGDKGAPTDADRQRAARWLAAHAPLWVTDEMVLANLTEAERATLRVRVLMGQLLDALAHEEAIRRPKDRATPPAASAP